MRSIRRSSNGAGRSFARRARSCAAPIAAALLAAGAAGAATGPAPAALELDAAWGGFARPDSSTELRIRLSDPTAGQATLRITAGRIVITTAVALHPGIAAQLSIPVPASESLGVDATFAGGSRLHRDIALRLTEDPLVALSPGASGSLPDDLAHADTDANGYPRHAEAYEAVDAIAVDGATLSRLDPLQLKALLAYIERCGPILAVGLPESAAALLRANAGCNGRALELLADPAQLGSAAEAILASAPPAPVRAASLRSLLAPASGAWPLVVAGLALYAAGALLLVCLRPRTALLAPCALAATIAVWSAGHLSTAAPRLAVWAESQNGDHWGRYAALAEFPGTGRALRTVMLPPLLEGAQPCDGADETDTDSDGAPPAVWRWDARGGRFTAVALRQRLFDARSICWHGAFPLLRRASLMRGTDGEPTVTNLGASAWSPGVAVLDNAAYALPTVAPGATSPLASSAPSVVAASAAQLGILRADGGSALLWPLDLPPLHLGRASIRAYLLERVRGVGEPP